MLEDSSISSYTNHAESAQIWSPSPQWDRQAPPQSKALDSDAKRILLSILVTNFLVAAGHYIAISSVMELIRGLSCSEYYFLHDPRFHQEGDDLDCSLIEIQDRTSTVFSYMLSINSLVSGFSAIWLAPRPLKKLGQTATMVIATIGPAAELFFLAWLPNQFSSASPPGGLRSPTASLYLLIAEAGFFGLVGCPDTLIGIASQAAVLQATPEALRSTWLARLTSCTFLGMLASTLVLQGLNVDTSSNSVADKLPILIGALASTLAVVWSLFTLPQSRSKPQGPWIGDQQAQQSSFADDEDDHREQNSVPTSALSAETSTSAPTLRSSLIDLFKPLHLLSPSTHGSSRRDWRLTKLIIAGVLCDQIALTTNTQVIYVQSHFELHAQELSLLLGLVGLTKWIYLVFAFPRLAAFVRKLCTSENPTDETSSGLPTTASALASASADRLLAILSLVMDVLAWAIVILAGRAYNYPAYLVALVLYALSGASVSSITSLASVLLPRESTVDDLVATLSSLSNVMSTVGPVINAAIYRYGLGLGFPELVFGLAAFISVAGAVLVGSVSPRL